MSKDGFDASIGLTFSLELFRRYRRNGVVQAELPRAPGIRGSCTAFLQLVNGEVVAAYIEDKQGLRHSSDKATLCRLDAEKGPFEWRLLLQAETVKGQSSLDALSTNQSPLPNVPASSLSPSSVPKIVSVVPQNQLGAWSQQQRDALYTVLANIDGVNTLEEIRGLVPFPTDLVDELMRILLGMKIITIAV